ncbi:Protein FATTY ACID EXPORT 2, chloroplastic [Cucurbita argyrosperma subsp. argyrosperma]|nr:Protein FATTY ACID EXPORT 2, chloroplastic [Cucurbita argyrosperma subsp. argyrosperma]
MAAVLAGVSQASLLFSPRISGALRSNTFSVRRIQFQSSTIGRGISFDCKTVRSAIRATDSKNEDIDIYPDTTGGDSSDKGIHGDGGGGSGGGKGGRGDNEGNSGEEEESNTNSGKKALSMSQKLTLGYAALVGGPYLFIINLLRFLFLLVLNGIFERWQPKSHYWPGSLSHTVACCFCKLLPSNLFLRSALGLGLSASLLVVMGSRFKNSGKIFPAGVVSLVSFIMTGGYMHGILRSSH